MDTTGTRMSQPSKNSLANSKQSIANQLTETAIARGGKMDKESLRVYTNLLSVYPAEDVVTALEQLARMKRNDYEPAIPEIGALVEMVKVATVARQNRSALKKSERLVRWQCTENPAHTLSGFPPSSDSLERRCQGIPKDRRTDWRPGEGRPICGAKMKVVHDDNDVTDSGPMEPWRWQERSGAR